MIGMETSEVCAAGWAAATVDEDDVGGGADGVVVAGALGVAEEEVAALERLHWPCVRDA